MTPGRDLEELISRCTSLVVWSHDSARNWPEWAAFLAGMEPIAEEAERLEVPGHAVATLLRLELSGRYDPETVDRLAREFADLFGVIAASTPAGAGRP